MHLPRLLSTLIALLPMAHVTTAETVAPKTPGLTFLYSLNCTLGEPLAVGNVPEGNRIVIPITGGTFSGPRLSGIACPLHPLSLTKHDED